MWNVLGKPVSVDWLNPEPIRVLYDFDGPKIFICEDAKGSPFLAYQCSEEKGVMRFLFVPCTSGLEFALTEGLADLRGALSKEPSWVVDIDYDMKAIRGWMVNVDRLPASVLPKRGVMLWRHLTPTTDMVTPRNATSQTVIKAAYTPSAAQIGQYRIPGYLVLVGV